LSVRKKEYATTTSEVHVANLSVDPIRISDTIALLKRKIWASMAATFRPKKYASALVEATTRLPMPLSTNKATIITFRIDAILRSITQYLYPISYLSDLHQRTIDKALRFP